MYRRGKRTRIGKGPPAGDPQGPPRRRVSPRYEYPPTREEFERMGFRPYFPIQLEFPTGDRAVGMPRSADPIGPPPPRPKRVDPRSHPAFRRGTLLNPHHLIEVPKASMMIRRGLRFATPFGRAMTILDWYSFQREIDRVRRGRMDDLGNWLTIQDCGRPRAYMLRGSAPSCTFNIVSGNVGDPLDIPTFTGVGFSRWFYERWFPDGLDRMRHIPSAQVQRQAGGREWPDQPYEMTPITPHPQGDRRKSFLWFSPAGHFIPFEFAPVLPYKARPALAPATRSPWPQWRDRGNSSPGPAGSLRPPPASRITATLGGASRGSGPPLQYTKVYTPEPPPKDEKEAKISGPHGLVHRVNIALGKSLALYSETNDLVDAIWGALHPCSRFCYGHELRGAQGSARRARERIPIDNSLRRAQWLWRNWDEVDHVEMVRRILRNELEDRIVGKAIANIDRQAGRGTSSNILRHGFDEFGWFRDGAYSPGSRVLPVGRLTPRKCRCRYEDG